MTEPNSNPNQPSNPFVSLLHNFRLPFPFPADPQSHSQKPSDSASDAGGANKPDIVRFSDPTPTVPPPLKMESDESGQSAAVVWQVYALGGYLLARWIWGKWKEKRNKDQPADENTSPPSN